MKIIITEPSCCTVDDSRLAIYKCDSSLVLMKPKQFDIESETFLRRLVQEFGTQAYKFRFSYGNQKLEPVYPYLIHKDTGCFSTVDNEMIIGGIFIRKGHTLDTIKQCISNEPGLVLLEEKATYQRLTT